MPHHCPNCSAPVEEGALECLKCTAVFGPEGWQPISHATQAKSLPSYGAWLLFSPFIVVVVTVVLLGVLYGPAGPWLTVVIAPPGIVIVWALIVLHCWKTSRSSPAKEKRLLRACVSGAVLLGSILLMYLTYPYFVKLVVNRPQSEAARHSMLVQSGSPASPADR